MTSLRDIELIPISYFSEINSDLELNLLRYYYIKSVYDNMTPQARRLVDQPSFYYYYFKEPESPNRLDRVLTNVLKNSDNTFTYLAVIAEGVKIDDVYPMVVDMNVMDVIISYIVDLDTLINLSITNKQMYEHMNIKSINPSRIGVNRPVIDWKDLIREYSKIHATIYYKSNNINEHLSSDMPANKTIIANVLRDGRLDIIATDNRYLDPKYLKYCTDPFVITSIIKQNVFKKNYTEPLKLTIRPESFIINGRFNIDLYLFYIQDFTVDYITYDFVNYNLNVNLDQAYIDAQILDFQLIIPSDKLDPLLIGPNNLDQLPKSRYDELIRNPNTKMVYDLIYQRKIKLDIYGASSAVSNQYVTAGNEVIVLIFETLKRQYQEEFMYIALDNAHWSAAEYMYNTFGPILNPVDKFINIRGKMTVERIKLIKQIATSLIFVIIYDKDDIIGGENDDISILEYFRLNNDLKYSIKITDADIRNMLRLDNMKSMAFVMPYLTHEEFKEILPKISNNQKKRLEYYYNKLMNDRVE